MAQGNHHPPGLLGLAGRVVNTGVGALQNRAELFAVEWQEERARMAELLSWTVGLLFATVMCAVLVTAVIISLFPQDARIYVAGGFALLYLIGAGGAWLGLRSVLRVQSFSASLNQLKKDRIWLESLSSPTSRPENEL